MPIELSLRAFAEDGPLARTVADLDFHVALAAARDIETALGVPTPIDPRP